MKKMKFTINPNILKSQSFNSKQSNHVVHNDKKKEKSKRKCRQKVKFDDM